MIPAMGAWSIVEVCRQARRWRDRFGAAAELPISVNVHSQQLEHADLLHQVEQALYEFNLPGSALVIEITETVALTDFELVVPQLQQLKELGVRVVLDDFGTGYSSLNYLARLPIDGVKIDRTFVQSMMHDSLSATIVRAVITLARELGLQVVAEGVETEEQRIALLRLGCTCAQGWLFGKAVDAELAANAIEKRAESQIRN